MRFVPFWEMVLATPGGMSGCAYPAGKFRHPKARSCSFSGRLQFRPYGVAVNLEDRLGADPAWMITNEHSKSQAETATPTFCLAADLDRRVHQHAHAWPWLRVGRARRPRDDLERAAPW